MPNPSLADLRRYAVARSLFRPTTLPRAIAKLGFVQADPIRAPARAQDLTLRHRVEGYRAGDLERRYARMDLEEDVFVNYGFLSREHHALMHPRAARREWTSARRRQAQAVLEFVRERGSAHPREVDAHFAHGKVTNWFGGSSNASTQLLDDMHYRGLLPLRSGRGDGAAARVPRPVTGGTATEENLRARRNAFKFVHEPPTGRAPWNWSWRSETSGTRWRAARSGCRRGSRARRLAPFCS